MKFKLEAEAVSDVSNPLNEITEVLLFKVLFACLLS